MYVKDKPMLFSEVCHSCGGCKLVCPQDAVIEAEYELGHVETCLLYTSITVRCGENAGNVFKAAEIKVYKSQVEDARENVKLLKEEKLSELTKFHAVFHWIQ